MGCACPNIVNDCPKFVIRELSWSRPKGNFVAMMRRFIIVAHARSGSTAIETALDSHPGIRCWPELLHPRVGDFALSVRPIEEGEPIADYLETQIFSQQGKAAIGFRVLNNHLLRNQAGRDYLTELAATGGADVIFLERRYLLDAVLSQARAERNSTYIFRKEEVPADYYEPFAVDAEQLVSRVRGIRRQMARLRQMTGSLRSLSLKYEDFADDVAKGAAQIVDFLGLEPAPLETRTTRIGRVRPNEVKNLDEVLAAFSDPAVSAELDHGYWKGG